METRICKQDGSRELYLEILSHSIAEWNSIRNILETLNSIDIHPRERLSADKYPQSGKSNKNCIHNYILLYMDTVEN
jgi:hypothetical protein